MRSDGHSEAYRRGSVLITTQVRRELGPLIPPTEACGAPENPALVLELLAQAFPRVSGPEPASPTALCPESPGQPQRAQLEEPNRPCLVASGVLGI
jgi:hypothetical protein